LKPRHRDTGEPCRHKNVAHCGSLLCCDCGTERVRWSLGDERWHGDLVDSQARDQQRAEPQTEVASHFRRLVEMIGEQRGPDLSTLQGRNEAKETRDVAYLALLEEHELAVKFGLELLEPEPDDNLRVLNLRDLWFAATRRAGEALRRVPGWKAAALAAGRRRAAGGQPGSQAGDRA
jgi:Ni,Fe-hydrogenase III component G